MRLSLYEDLSLQITQPAGVIQTVVGVLLRPTRKVSEVLWNEAYGFSSLSEKTRKSNRLQMSLQRQHFLLSYLKTQRVGPAGAGTCDLLLS